MKQKRENKIKTAELFVPPLILCNFFLFVYYRIYHSIDYKHCNYANAKQRELIPCIQAYRIVMNQNWTLCKINKYAYFTKQVQEFAINRERGCKIQHCRANQACKEMSLKGCIFG
jgi:hypothetical protein